MSGKIIMDSRIDAAEKFEFEKLDPTYWEIPLIKA